MHQPDEGDKNIQMLLSPKFQQALVAATNDQFIRYAPFYFQAGEPIGESSRGDQLMRVLFEFGVGLPVKFLNHMRAANAALGPTNGLFNLLTFPMRFAFVMGLTLCRVVGNILFASGRAC